MAPQHSFVLCNAITKHSTFRPGSFFAAWCRALRRAAHVLPQLGAQLAHALASGATGPAAAAAMGQFEAGLEVIEGCTTLASAPWASSNAVVRHCQSAQLMHNAGPPLLSVLAATHGPGSLACFKAAASQLVVFDACLELLRDLLLAGRLPEEAAAALDLPALIRWLAAVAAQLQPGLRLPGVPGERTAGPPAHSE